MWREKDDLLRTSISLTLLAYLPELGTLDRRQIAAWWEWLPSTAVARCGANGRSGVGAPGSALPCTWAVASRCNPVIREFYQRLLAAGKPKKLALTACMRKLVVILNSMLKHRSPWRGLSPQVVSHSS